MKRHKAIVVLNLLLAGKEIELKGYKVQYQEIGDHYQICINYKDCIGTYLLPFDMSVNEFIRVCEAIPEERNNMKKKHKKQCPFINHCMGPQRFLCKDCKGTRKVK